MTWHHATTQQPCVVCQRGVGQCSISHDGTLCFCWHVSDGALKPGKSGGWLHRIGDAPAKPVAPHRNGSTPKHTMDAATMLAEWQANTKAEHFTALAADLGVNSWSVRTLGAVWCESRGFWAMPMRDGNNNVIGLQRRWPDGTKKSLGSGGLFVPQMDLGPEVWIVEGFSDTAAALSMEVPAIGRYNATGSTDLLLDWLAVNKVRRVTIVPDADNAGWAGATELQARLKVPSIILPLPCKDMRNFLQQSGTREMLDCMAKGLVWKR